MSDKRKLIS